MIKNFEPRLYQQTIFASASKSNTLVVLPTGMGKTNIFLMLAAHRLKLYPKSKVLFIGPTRPLIDQYLEVFKKYFDIKESEMAIFTGHVKPEKREELWKTSKIIFSTPQGLENDIISRRIDLSEVSLIGFDEAHRAVGDYAYVFIAKQYMKLADYPRIVALTASPGSDMEKISEVCKNLFIEDIEVKTDEDSDVKDYVQEIDIKWIPVNLTPPFAQIQKLLKNFLKEKFAKLKDIGVLKKKNVSLVTRKDILSMQVQIRMEAMREKNNYTLWSALSILAEILKIYHGLELLETQGVSSLYEYFDKMRKESSSTKVKAVKNIASNPDFKASLYKAEEMYNEGYQHPKLVELQKIIDTELKKNSNLKLIIFNQYRDNAKDIVDTLNKLDGIKAALFVGQMKKGDTGLSQKEQKEVLDKFRNDEYNILVATSVGEEGLDIPRVDLVIFYEPVSSAIRHIQRRGRTGRQEKGRVLILMTKNTRDEAYKWSSHHKEKNMYKTLKSLKSKLKLENINTLDTYIEEDKVVIYADHREKSSGVIKELIDLDVKINLEQLKVGDYVLSRRVGVEFKSVQDFVDSIVDKRLLNQLKDLKQNFERPLIIIEGEDNIYNVRNVHEHAIKGMIATINVSYNIPIIYTKNPKETALMLKLIAKREQGEDNNEYNLHADKKPLTLKEQQEYIISSLPNVGPTLAKELLNNFGSVRKVINAKKEELEKVQKVGKRIAEKIEDISEREYG